MIVVIVVADDKNSMDVDNDASMDMDVDMDKQMNVDNQKKHILIPMEQMVIISEAIYKIVTFYLKVLL